MEFCGKAQFPHSFERIARNWSPENFHTRKLGDITAFYVVKSFTICQHVIAVLKKTDKMQSFIERSECARGDIVVSKLANIGKEANPGNKKRKATEKRKGPAKAKRVQIKRMVFPAEPQNLVTDIPCAQKILQHRLHHHQTQHLTLVSSVYWHFPIRKCLNAMFVVHHTARVVILKNRITWLSWLKRRCVISIQKVSRSHITRVFKGLLSL